MVGYCKLPLVHLSVELSTSGENCTVPTQTGTVTESPDAVPLLCHKTAGKSISRAHAPIRLGPFSSGKVKYNGAALMVCLTLSWG